MDWESGFCRMCIDLGVMCMRMDEEIYHPKAISAETAKEHLKHNITSSKTSALA